MRYATRLIGSAALSETAGEMSVGTYYHDERFEGGGGMTLADTIEKLFKYYVKQQ